MDVCADEKSISINAVIGVVLDDVENKQNMESFTSNYCNIPNIVSHLALI